jgi:transcriptional regulator GlxA family with amidase domain
MNLPLPPTRQGSFPKPAPLARAEGCQRFTFLLLDGFMMMSLAGAIEALRLANHVAAREAYAWQLWSMDGETVVNSAGLPTPVNAAAEPPRRGDWLVVVGGSQHDVRQGFPKALLSLLRRAHAHGTRLIGLCTGGLALVELGIIPAIQCAVHWEYQQPLSERDGDFAARTSAFSLGAAPTAAGGVAAAELFLHLIAGRLGRSIAAGVADSLLLTAVRSADEVQRASPLAHAGARVPALRIALAAMSRGDDEILSVQDIAAEAGVSVRQLERLFHQHLQTSPLKHYSGLRPDRARRLLSMTDLSVSEIACATGFGNSSQLSRRFKARFGYSPHHHSLLRQAHSPQDRDNRPCPLTPQGERPC